MSGDGARGQNLVHLQKVGESEYIIFPVTYILCKASIALLHKNKGNSFLQRPTTLLQHYTKGRE